MRAGDPRRGIHVSSCRLSLRLARSISLSIYILYIHIYYIYIYILCLYLYLYLSLSLYMYISISISIYLYRRLISRLLRARRSATEPRYTPSDGEAGTDVYIYIYIYILHMYIYIYIYIYMYRTGRRASRRCENMVGVKMVLAEFVKIQTWTM